MKRSVLDEIVPLQAPPVLLGQKASHGPPQFSAPTRRLPHSGEYRMCYQHQVAVVQGLGSPRWILSSQIRRREVKLCRMQAADLPVRPMPICARASRK